MNESKTSVERMKDTDAVRAALLDIKRCFAERLPNAKWFIHCGTALGAYYGRNEPDGGKVLPGDNDLDIGVLVETCPEEDFIKAFDGAGFRRGAFFHHPKIKTIGAVLRYIIAKKDGIPIDFYFMYLKGRKRWWLTASCVPHVLAAYLVEDLRPIKFLGIEVPAPYPLEAYCYQRWKKVGDKFPHPLDGGEMVDRFPGWTFPRSCC